jgi:D-hexose-6-phosphate mutarotase
MHCAADGAEATVTLYGAHLVSWKTGDGKERLFVSRSRRWTAAAPSAAACR